ncbi:MAG: carbohydrate porin [Planctomycetaceae bacterium]
MQLDRFVWMAFGAALCILGAPRVAAEDQPQPERVERAQKGGDREFAGELAELRARAAQLEGRAASQLDHEIRSYLGTVEGHSPLGEMTDWNRIEVSFRLTSVTLATVGAEPFDRSVAGGDVFLDLKFHLTDNLHSFVSLTGNVPGATFPGRFGAIAGVYGATANGFSDGIDVDGTVPTAPGSLRVYEAGLHWRHTCDAGTFHLVTGALDPRDDFAQNAFAGDERTQFLNNLFDDPPAVSWRTTSSGSTVLGILVAFVFGDDGQYRVDLGWYNSSGQFFDNGLLLAQFSWRGEVRGRTMNVRLYGHVDLLPTDEAAGIGLSVDWMATDKIGVFFRASWRDNQRTAFQVPPGNDPNPVEQDWALGALAKGLLPNRPDDSIGLAWGLVKAPHVFGAPESFEMVLELFYRTMLEGGHLQISPFVQLLIDPGLGTFVDDTLLILGVRLHVVF